MRAVVMKGNDDMVMGDGVMRNENESLCCD